MIEYGCARVPGIEDTVFATAARHLRATESSTAWLDRCYPPAIAEIPEPWRKQVHDFVDGEIGFMSEDEARRVETWGMT